MSDGPRKFEDLTQAELLGLLAGDAAPKPPGVVARQTYDLPGFEAANVAFFAVGLIVIAAGAVEALYVLLGSAPKVVALFALAPVALGWGLTRRTEYTADTHVTVSRLDDGTLEIEREREGRREHFTVAPGETPRLVVRPDTDGYVNLILATAASSFILATCLGRPSEAFTAMHAGLATFLAGEPPPPWQVYPGEPPWWGGWRQGNAEGWLRFTFLPFWHALDPAGQAAYMERFPPPDEEWREYLAVHWQRDR